MTEEASDGPDPSTWAPRLAMERYLRYRLRRVDQCPDGWYTQLRPFVEWCERVGVHSVGVLRCVDLEEYYEHRRRRVEVDRLDQERRTLELFCEFLEDVGAAGEWDLAGCDPRPRDRSTGSPHDNLLSTGERQNGSTRRGTQGKPLEPVGTWDDVARDSGHLEYEIGPEESVTTAVVRVASALDGRSPRFMPPLRNVLDPRALDAIFEAKPEGTARTGGRLSFVYGSCQVILESGEYLTLQPLDLVRRGEPTLPPGTRQSPDGGQRGSHRSRRDPIRWTDPDDPNDE